MFRLSLFRRLARPIAILVLLAGPVSLLHSGIDDPACASLDGSEEGNPSLGGAPADSSDHCLVCHWTRTLRSPSLSVARTHHTLVVGARVEVGQTSLRHAPALDRGPARAPPSSL